MLNVNETKFFESWKNLIAKLAAKGYYGVEHYDHIATFKYATISALLDQDLDVRIFNDKTNRIQQVMTTDIFISENSNNPYLFINFAREHKSAEYIEWGGIYVKCEDKKYRPLISIYKMTDLMNLCRGK